MGVTPDMRERGEAGEGRDSPKERKRGRGEGVEFLAPYLCDRWAIWTENSFNDNGQAVEDRPLLAKPPN